MAPKIFITGATGYIGGDALYELYHAHPDYEITALVRNTTSGSQVAASFPKVRLVYGTLEDSAILSEEASKANIVVHTADSSDHEGAASAITKGLTSGHSATDPGFYIHLSGTGILTYFDAAAGRSGEEPDREPFNDLAGVSKLTSLPDEAFHRDIDKLVLAANSKAVKTAIVCPPVIYGPGRGSGNQRSRQVYSLAELTLQTGQTLLVGKGKAQWDVVHVRDLSVLYNLLVEKAAGWSEKQSSQDEEIWGPKAYYLAEDGHIVWGDVARKIAEVAREKGLIKGEEVRTLSHDEALQLGGFAAASWGLNSRGVSGRAKTFLAWKPKERGLMQEIPDIVEGEAKRLGLTKGHAELVKDATK